MREGGGKDSRRKGGRGGRRRGKQGGEGLSFHVLLCSVLYPGGVQ